MRFASRESRMRCPWIAAVALVCARSAGADSAAVPLCRASCQEDPQAPWKKEVGVRVTGPAPVTFGLNSGPVGGPFRIYSWSEERAAKVFSCDCKSPYVAAQKRRVEQLKEAQRLKDKAAALDAREDELAAEARRQDAELRRRWEERRHKIEARVDALDLKINLLHDEMNKALRELLNGQYCSQCHRVASEIERVERVSFPVHINNVKGKEERAPQWLIDETAKRYLGLIMTAGNERDAQVAEGQAEHIRTQNAISALWRDLRARLDEMDDRIALLEKDARDLIAKAAQDLKVAESAKSECERDNGKVRSDCTFKKAVRAWGVFFLNDDVCPQRFDFTWLASASGALGTSQGSWQGGQHRVKCSVRETSQCDETAGSACSCEIGKAMTESGHLLVDRFDITIMLHERQPAFMDKSPLRCKDLYKAWLRRQSH